MLNLNTARAARLTRCLKTAVLLLSTGMTVLLWAAEQNHKQWSDYGGGPDSSHFIALDQINKSNVSQLQVAWVYPTGDDNAYLFNPIVVDNVMYVLAKNSSLVALDATTGKEIWIHENLPGLTKPRHRLLGKQEPQGQEADLRDQRLPPGDRCPDGQIDSDVREEWIGGPEARSGPRSQDHQSHSNRHARARLRRPDSVGLNAWRSLSVASRRYSRL